MRKIGVFALAALIASCSVAAAQDNYPSQTVKIVLPNAPGSTTDILTRLLADHLARKWGKTTVVENIAGGMMNVGAAAVARAAPDGYTLMVAPPAPFTINHLISKDLSYSP
jgi:tripartite-type tricarboxylate transporter receptor subunit TctC